MTTCREWTQPDGNHFHGLCTNEFWPKAGTDGCNVCVSPIYNAIDRCKCRPEIGVRQTLYVKIQKVAAVDACWQADFIGSFATNNTPSIANCFYTSAERANATALLTTPVCFLAGASPPFGFSGAPTTPVPTTYQRVDVQFLRAPSGTYLPPNGRVDVTVRGWVWDVQNFGAGPVWSLGSTGFPIFAPRPYIQLSGSVAWCNNGSSTANLIDTRNTPAQWSGTISTAPIP